MNEFELYEQYLDGELDAAGKAAFEKRLQDDAAFAREFDEYRRVMSTSMAQWQEFEPEREALKSTLQRITAPRQAAVKRLPLRWWLPRVAAGIAVILMAWALFFRSEGPSDKDLYVQFAGEEKVSLTSRGANHDSLRSAVTNFIYDKKYDSAANLLRPMAASGADSAAAVYLGYCYMMDNQDSAAEAVLNPTHFPTGPVARRARYYLALLYLKTNRTGACKTLLNGLQAEGGDEYAIKAAKLLRQLR